MVVLGNLQQRISSNYSVICNISVLGATLRCVIAFDFDTSGPKISQMLTSMTDIGAEGFEASISSHSKVVKLVLLQTMFDHTHFQVTEICCLQKD